MQPLCRAFGVYQTNCYIVKTEFGELIIDPGQGAREWVKQNAPKPLAIICTHGHFDHIFDVAPLKHDLGVPVFIHEADAFMLREGSGEVGHEPCEPDFAIGEGWYEVGGVEFELLHFGGHTPGCSMVRVADAMFSGDFLFKDSLGRWDFEYSDGTLMLESLKRAKLINSDFVLYPGHGESSTLAREQRNLDGYIRYVASTI